MPAADETSRAGARFSRTYEIEASFYRDLAADPPRAHAELPPRRPRPARPTATSCCSRTSPRPARAIRWRGARCRTSPPAIDELVLLQGPRWGDETLLEIPWLHRSSPEAIDGLVALVTHAVGPFKEHYTERLDADTMALVDRLVPRLDGYLRARPRPWTIVHGDFRADNLLFGAERVVVVDWQTVGLGPGPSDVSYLLGASLTPDDRRQHEAALVDRYVQGLVGQGVDVDRDHVWEQYRRYSFGGLIMAIVASFLVQRTDRGDEMFITMAERHARQALDLDAESLI